MSCTCKLCYGSYESICASDVQGADCCGSVELAPPFRPALRIICGYGSKFDTSVFDFVGVPLEKGTDPICDECIGRMLEEGRIILNERLTDSYFDLL